jgi:hypothetical protein
MMAQETSIATKLLFGYSSWEETKLGVDAFFEGEVDVTDDPMQQLKIVPNESWVLLSLNAFEQCQPKPMLFAVTTPSIYHYHMYYEEGSVLLILDMTCPSVGSGTVEKT